MPAVCETAPKAELSAFGVPGSASVPPRLYINARGTLPDQCRTVLIRMSPIDVWPPEFSVEACRVASLCAEVVTPYDVTQDFDLGSIPERIVVHDADGPHEIPVEIVPDRTPARPSAAASDEATGVSIGAASLGGALADAARQLSVGQHPNTPRRVIAVEISYEEGGILPPVLKVRAKKG
jgi:hypothetical protein